MLVVNSSILNAVNSTVYPLNNGYGVGTHSKRNLLKGILTTKACFDRLKELGYEPVMATHLSVMDLGLQSDLAMKWQGEWRMFQVRSSYEGAQAFFAKKARGIYLYDKAAEVARLKQRSWTCPECLILDAGRLVCLNSKGRGSYFPPAVRSDDYLIERYVAPMRYTRAA